MAGIPINSGVYYPEYGIWQGNGETYDMSPADYQKALAADQAKQQQASQQAFSQYGLTPYQGSVSYGLQGDQGGENATWAVNPQTGQQEAAIRGPGGYYFASDLANKFGSLDAAGKVTSGLDEFNNPQQVFQTNLWSARPSSDVGLRDLGPAALMALPVGLGALGVLGGAAGAAAAPAAAETGAALGSGLTAGTTTGGIGGGALGSGLSAGSTASGIGAGATGTGLTAAAPAGSALAPGFFAAEAAGGGGALGSVPGGGVGGAGAASSIGLGQIAAGAIPAALGAFGANQQANAYGNLAGQYMAMGAPYRSRLSDLYNNPDDFLNSKEVQIPVQQATNVLARSLSRGGNPVGSGNALQELQNYSANLLFGRLGQEKDRLAGFGGLSAYNQAAPGAASAEIGAQKGIYDALGAGVADVLNPPRRYTLQDLMRGY